MVAEKFAQLVEELGKALEMPRLAPDDNNTCLLRFPGNIEIFIEMDRDGEHLILGSDFGELPPGRYRENIFEAALVTNNHPPPLHGILAYSKHAGHLVLYERINAPKLNGEEVLEALMPFVAKALKWREAIANDQIPDISTTSPNLQAGIFGLYKKL